MFADVTSANVVGYMECSRPQKNFCGGSMFCNVGKDCITLADLKITGPKTKGAWRNNTITFFASDDVAKLDNNRKYWLDKDGQWRKFDLNGSADLDPVMTKEQIAAVVINPGEGFVCDFVTTGAKITYSGEVITGTDKQIVIDRPQKNFVLVNPSASPINIGQLTITGPKTKGAWRNNTITFFASDDVAKLDNDRKYWLDKDGQWRKFDLNGSADLDPVMTKEEIEAVVINPGEGVACDFVTTNAKVSLPTSL